MATLITGASAGLGADFARLFAADKHDVILVARRRERLEQLAAELTEQYGVRCTVEAVDLSDRAARDALLERLREEEIDYLVNNAGYGSNGKFWELPLDGELGQVEVNIEALVHLTHALLPAMLARNAGRILNIASTAAFQPGPYMSVYYATKAFVLSFTEALAHELRQARTNVTVTAHCPGPTATEFGAVAGNDKSNLFKKASIATSEDVARHGYRAMHAGKQVAIYGAMNTMTAWSTKLVPRGIAAGIAGSLNRSE